MEQTQTFRQTVDRVLAMMQPGFDWDAYYEQDEYDSLEDLFRKCCIVGLPEGDEQKKYFECGSVEIKDTPDSLYRILYLLKPARVNFSDMYKTCLLGFYSADKRFLVTAELYKYELGLYFYCPKEALGGNGSIVQGGWPGCDNGTHCTDEDGKAFFEMVTRAANYEWEVYPGNNFKV